ncbi:hypothetical protein VTL71DRAFT_4544 [Oculimacula yallundae]|uniref:Uncharacterized protein n=1 Tax=Oculimacula yallundae TaxID=86028 RepID=A0ABR4C2A0_9HELO
MLPAPTRSGTFKLKGPPALETSLSGLARIWVSIICPVGASGRVDSTTNEMPGQHHILVPQTKEERSFSGPSTPLADTGPTGLYQLLRRWHLTSYAIGVQPNIGGVAEPNPSDIVQCYTNMARTKSCITSNLGHHIRIQDRVAQSKNNQSPGLTEAVADRAKRGKEKLGRRALVVVT